MIETTLIDKMRELPPGLEKFLSSLGVNTSLLKWKLHYLEEAWKRKHAALTISPHEQRYKHCRECGELSLADKKICGACGKTLPSYTSHKLSQSFAFMTPQFNMVSRCFIGIIVLLFAWQVATVGFSALIAPSKILSLHFGAFAGVFLMDGHQYWRVFSMALCHIGLMHIAFNSIAISQVLPYFERDIGPWGALLLITVTQIAAALAHVFWYDSRVLTAGASGIAFGLIGFGLAFAHRSGNRPARQFFFQWLIYGFIFGLLIRANNAAHLGGLLAGIPLGYWMASGTPRGIAKRLIRTAGFICLLIWFVCLCFLVVSILRIPGA